MSAPALSDFTAKPKKPKWVAPAQLPCNYGGNHMFVPSIWGPVCPCKNPVNAELVRVRWIVLQAIKDGDAQRAAEEIIKGRPA